VSPVYVLVMLTSPVVPAADWLILMDLLPPWTWVVLATAREQTPEIASVHPPALSAPRFAYSKPSEPDDAGASPASATPRRRVMFPEPSVVPCTLSRCDPVAVTEVRSPPSTSMKAPGNRLSAFTVE
jgi:hypothetical protein